MALSGATADLEPLGRDDGLRRRFRAGRLHGPRSGALTPPARRFVRELNFTIPVKAGLLPAGLEGSDVVIFWRDEHAAARAVPLASVWLTGAGGGRGAALPVETRPRQRSRRPTRRRAGTRTRTRRYVYKGIVGASMGGGGTGSVGFRNFERWDFIAPLGGPANWTHMLHYVRSTTSAASAPRAPTTRGTSASTAVAAVGADLRADAGVLQNWYYLEGRDGQGGTFDREEYRQIFRDMALALGNPGMYNVDSVYLPPGVPDSWWQQSGSERCSNPTVLEDFYDDEYNPDGALPVIVPCDGAEAAPGGRDRPRPLGPRRHQRLPA
ncbi:MAG: hypothetical protein MZV70_00270 [Desulfobacterales bacterium]|nr:hypothetical protein [Desulfobacterales bacterium]